jgi:hypothetical protein
MNVDDDDDDEKEPNIKVPNYSSTSLDSISKIPYLIKLISGK